MNKRHIKNIVKQAIIQNISIKKDISDEDYADMLKQARDWAYEMRSAVAQWGLDQPESEWYQALVKYKEIPSTLAKDINNVYKELDKLCSYLDSQAGD